jgi:cytochrome c551/c552
MDDNFSLPTDFTNWKQENLAKFAVEALAKIKLLQAERDTFRDAWRQALMELDRAER